MYSLYSSLHRLWLGQKIYADGRILCQAIRAASSFRSIIIGEANEWATANQP